MYIFIFIVIGFLLLYIMPINIFMSYKQKNRKNDIKIHVKTLYGLINYSLDIPYLKMKIFDRNPGLNYEIDLENKEIKGEYFNQEKKYSIEEFKKILKKIKKINGKYKEPINYFIDKIHIKKLNLKTDYDIEDAATTGIIAGLIYSIKSNLIFWILKYKPIKYYNFNVTPLFKQTNIIDLKFYCIIQFKLGHIINVGIKSLIIYKKGGELDGRTSN